MREICQRQEPAPREALAPVPAGAVAGVSAAAWWPARQATAADLLDGLSAAPPEPPRGSSRGLLVTAVAMLLVTAVAEVLMTYGLLPPRASVVSGVAMLLAFVALTPFLLIPLVRLLGRLVPERWRVEGSLAVEQIVRNPIRTALTAGVLVVAVSNAIGLGHAIRDQQAPRHHGGEIGRSALLGRDQRQPQVQVVGPVGQPPHHRPHPARARRRIQPLQQEPRQGGRQRLARRADPAGVVHRMGLNGLGQGFGEGGIGLDRRIGRLPQGGRRRLEQVRNLAARILDPLRQAAKQVEPGHAPDHPFGGRQAAQGLDAFAQHR